MCPSILLIPKVGKKQGAEGRWTFWAIIGPIAIIAAVVILNLVPSYPAKLPPSETENLKAIAQGTETYLRGNRRWPPSLVGHFSYAPFGATQLSTNEQKFPRYYIVHPTTSGFHNATGLEKTLLRDMRFLLISNLSADAAPTITHAADFERWWRADESATPDLHVFRGDLRSMFHRVQVTAKGPGGSYQVDGTATSSEGSILSTHTRYHVAGTVISLSEGDLFGSPEIQFALTADVEYEFDPCRPPGTKWSIPPGPAGSCPSIMAYHR